MKKFYKKNLKERETLLDIMVSLETKDKIINKNKKLGITTVFYHDNSSILGYSEDNTIYLNEEGHADILKVNEHELIHFFEDTDIFNEVKREVLKSISSHVDIDKVRNEYSLSYYGLYSDIEIANGVIDTEIVIDYLNNSLKGFHDDKLDLLREKLLSQTRSEVEERRYLNLSLKQNIDNMNLSKWEKLFLQNYVDSKEYTIPQGKDRISKIREDIEKEYQRLINLPKEAFEIRIDSPSLEREFNGELTALEARGEKTKADYIRNNKEISLKELSNIYSTKLYEEYKHIVDFIRTTDYETSFKVLMLRETLIKIYKKDNNKVIINNRKLNETIDGHMILNETVLDVIYNKLDNYNNFAELYYAGVVIYNQIISESSTVSIENVNTYGMGRWIKFEGKRTNPDTYLDNVQKLKTLVQDTPWCTKRLAATQLEQGDFYVFVDNKEKPHIAVKLNGNKIDEVRGLLNGNLQELEPVYRDVAISFLENNKSIAGGKKWLEKEEGNKKLINWNKKIDEGVISQEEVPKLIEDMHKLDYRSHSRKNSNLVELRNKLVKIKDKLAIYFNCQEDEICIGDYKHFEETSCPYVVILGDADFEYSEIQELPKLKIISGNAKFIGSLIREMPDLEFIGGDAVFVGSRIKRLPKLEIIRGSALFQETSVKDLSMLRCIDGRVDFSWSKILELPMLEIIGGIANFEKSLIQEMPMLKYIGSVANFAHSQIKRLPKLEKVGDNVIFKNSLIQEMPMLRSVEGKTGEAAKHIFEELEIILKHNQRLVSWSEKIDEGVISQEDIPKLIEDAFKLNYKTYYKKNSNIVELRNKLVKIKDKLAIYFNCQEDEIYIGDYKHSDKEVSCPYAVIFGNAGFSYSKIQELPNLKFILGDADFAHSQIKRLPKLEFIGGIAFFSETSIQEIPMLHTIGGGALFLSSQIQGLPMLESVGGNADFEHSKIRELPMLHTIGGNANFSYSKKIRKLPNLKFIGKNAYFSNSRICELPNLQVIGGIANFDNTQIQEMPMLESVDGKEYHWQKSIKKVLKKN